MAEVHQRNPKLEIKKKAPNQSTSGATPLQTDQSINTPAMYHGIITKLDTKIRSFRNKLIHLMTTKDLHRVILRFMLRYMIRQISCGRGGGLTPPPRIPLVNLFRSYFSSFFIGSTTYLVKCNNIIPFDNLTKCFNI